MPKVLKESTARTADFGDADDQSRDLLRQATTRELMSSVDRIHPPDHHARPRWLAWGGIAGQIVFVGGWLVLGAIEGHGFSAGRHDISDLGALTAHHATASRITEGIAGAVT